MPMTVAAFPHDPGQSGWAPIEHALGVTLDQFGRADLAEALGLYLALRKAELEAPAEADAIKYANDIKIAAACLQNALWALGTNDGAARHVAQLFDSARGEIARRTGNDFLALGEIEPALVGLILAAERVVNSVGKIETTAPTLSWQWLVGNLADFAGNCGMKVTASKGNNTSPFVIFVDAVQATFPRPYRRGTQSIEALSKAISPALTQWRLGTNKRGG